MHKEACDVCKVGSGVGLLEACRVAKPGRRDGDDKMEKVELD